MDRQALLKNEDIFHRMLAHAKQRPSSETWGLCVSGGVDSICLLHVMAQVSVALKRQAVVFSIHHGSTCDEEQSQYRHRCHELVRQTAKKLKLPFLSNVDSSSTQSPRSQSEGDLRAFRREALQNLASSCSNPIVWLTAHHQDDALETRLLQLIRGIGPEAFANFLEGDAVSWRPFFHIPKSELQSLADRQGWVYLDDPSNLVEDPLRNWLRREWLPRLESKRAGGVKSLHRSLELLSQALVSIPSKDQEVSGALLRADFLSYTPQRQRAFVVQNFKCLEVNRYTMGQVEEVVKRLKASGPVSFCVCGVVWTADKSHIKASRESASSFLKSH